MPRAGLGVWAESKEEKTEGNEMVRISCSLEWNFINFLPRIPAVGKGVGVPAAVTVWAVLAVPAQGTAVLSWQQQQGVHCS